MPPPTTTTKVWLVTSATSPLGFSIARQALRTGDSVVAGCTPQEYMAWKHANSSAPASGNATPNNASTASAAKGKPAARGKLDPEELESLDIDILSRLGGSSCLVVPLNTKALPSCQAALAHAISTFGRVDILISCTSHTFYGSLEECTEWAVREQLDVNYFGTINIVKTVVRDMRERGTGGHILCVTSLAAQTGTPGLSLLTAAHHAVEGFMEGMAFEIAPFNIRVTNVEPSLMTYLLTNPVHLPPAAPPTDGDEMDEDESVVGDEDDDDDEDRTTPRMGAKNIRNMLERVTAQRDLVGYDTPSPMAEDGASTPRASDGALMPRILQYPSISAAAQLDLVAETTKVIMAVAGKANPPARIVIGGEESGEDGEGGVQSVKERMKAVSEELEEFLECALSVDVSNAVEDASVDEGVDEANPQPA
ncbi:hypothetical protein TWF696_006033 [Orbilia brochopaga]|uniref:Uncharacterized protein n=1 Tax=Orbilia brochopaga TaxID=3140254 RepID=A0AAV9UWE7_9PEZI